MHPRTRRTGPSLPSTGRPRTAWPLCKRLPDQGACDRDIKGNAADISYVTTKSHSPSLLHSPPKFPLRKIIDLYIGGTDGINLAADTLCYCT